MVATAAMLLVGVAKAKFLAVAKMTKQVLTSLGGKDSSEDDANAEIVESINNNGESSTVAKGIHQVAPLVEVGDGEWIDTNIISSTRFTNRTRLISAIKISLPSNKHKHRRARFNIAAGQTKASSSHAR